MSVKSNTCRLMGNTFGGSIYHHHRGDSTKPHSGLSLLPKLKMEHVVLTSYSKMRVDLAAQVCPGHSLCEFKK